MYIQQFFTEYDESLTHTLNIDPLGMTVIWSVFGQKIFKNRVSSISNDVRNYTLNLLHHLTIKELVESSLTLHGKLASQYPNLDSLSFKQACLIHCENVFVYAMLEAKQNVDTQGVLGVSKGRARMGKGEEITLTFSHTAQSQLLVRQLTLGVSGRYKTPFLEMDFFDKGYRYKHPRFELQWNKAEEFINSCQELRAVKDLLKAHLIQLLTQKTTQMPSALFSEVPQKLKDAYSKAFCSPEHVGSLSKDFWLSVTGLNQGAAGFLYDAIKKRSKKGLSGQVLFAHALESCSDEKEALKLQNIIDIEPFLAECELLFTLLMSQRKQPLSELYKAYIKLDRNVLTLPSLASKLADNTAVKQVLKGSGESRYQQLLKLGDVAAAENESGFQMVVNELLQYHAYIMNVRGQSAWVDMDNQGQYRCHVKLASTPTVKKYPLNYWYHRYYLGEFKSLILGLEGEIVAEQTKDVEKTAAMV